MSKNDKKRHSILKPPKQRNPLLAVEVKEVNLSRRVSFASSNKVKEFASCSEKATIWDDTYEEVVVKSDSSAGCNSSEDMTKYCAARGAPSLEDDDREEHHNVTFFPGDLEKTLHNEEEELSLKSRRQTIHFDLDETGAAMDFTQMVHVDAEETASEMDLTDAAIHVEKNPAKERRTIHFDPNSTIGQMDLTGSRSIFCEHHTVSKEERCSFEPFNSAKGPSNLVLEEKENINVVELFKYSNKTSYFGQDATNNKENQNCNIKFFQPICNQRLVNKADPDYMLKGLEKTLVIDDMELTQPVDALIVCSSDQVQAKIRKSTLDCTLRNEEECQRGLAMAADENQINETSLKISQPEMELTQPIPRKKSLAHDRTTKYEGDSAMELTRAVEVNLITDEALMKISESQMELTQPIQQRKSLAYDRSTKYEGDSEMELTRAVEANLITDDALAKMSEPQREFSQPISRRKSLAYDRSTKYEGDSEMELTRAVEANLITDEASLKIPESQMELTQPIRQRKSLAYDRSTKYEGNSEMELTRAAEVNLSTGEALAKMPESQMEFTQPISRRKSLAYDRPTKYEGDSEMELTRAVEANLITHDASAKMSEPQREFLQPISRRKSLAYDRPTKYEGDSEMELTRAVEANLITHDASAKMSESQMEFTQPISGRKSLAYDRSTKYEGDSEMELTRAVEVNLSTGETSVKISESQMEPTQPIQQRKSLAYNRSANYDGDSEMELTRTVEANLTTGEALAKMPESQMEFTQPIPRRKSLAYDRSTKYKGDSEMELTRAVEANLITNEASMKISESQVELTQPIQQRKSLAYDRSTKYEGDSEMELTRAVEANLITDETSVKMSESQMEFTQPIPRRKSLAHEPTTKCEGDSEMERTRAVEVTLSTGDALVKNSKSQVELVQQIKKRKSSAYDRTTKDKDEPDLKLTRSVEILNDSSMKISQSHLEVTQSIEKRTSAVSCTVRNEEECIIDLSTSVLAENVKYEESGKISSQVKRAQASANENEVLNVTAKHDKMDLTIPISVPGGMQEKIDQKGNSLSSSSFLKKVDNPQSVSVKKGNTAFQTAQNSSLQSSRREEQNFSTIESIKQEAQLNATEKDAGECNVNFSKRTEEMINKSAKSLQTSVYERMSYHQENSVKADCHPDKEDSELESTQALIMHKVMCGSKGDSYCLAEFDIAKSEIDYELDKTKLLIDHTLSVSKKVSLQNETENTHVFDTKKDHTIQESDLAASMKEQTLLDSHTKHVCCEMAFEEPISAPVEIDSENTTEKKQDDIQIDSIHALIRRQMDLEGHSTAVHCELDFAESIKSREGKLESSVSHIEEIELKIKQTTSSVIRRKTIFENHENSVECESDFADEHQKEALKITSRQFKTTETKAAVEICQTQEIVQTSFNESQMDKTYKLASPPSEIIIITDDEDENKAGNCNIVDCSADKTYQIMDATKILASLEKRRISIVRRSKSPAQVEADLSSSLEVCSTPLFKPILPQHPTPISDLSSTPCWDETLSFSDEDEYLPDATDIENAKLKMWSVLAPFLKPYTPPVFIYNRPERIPRSMEHLDTVKAYISSMQEVQQSAQEAEKTVQQEIREFKKRAEDLWVYEGYDGEWHSFDLHLVNIKARLKIDESSCTVQDFQMKSSIDEFDWDPIFHNIARKMFIFPSLCNNSESGLKLNIFLEDFFQIVLEFQRIFKELTEVFQKCSFFFYDDLTAYYIVPLCQPTVSCKITLDLSDLDKFTEESIRVEDIVGNINESDIKSFIKGCPKGYTFLRCFAKDVINYLELKQEQMKRKHLNIL